MNEQDISDIAEVIPEVMMANKSGYKAGIVYGFLLGCVVSTMAFIMWVFYSVSQAIK